MAVKPSTNLMMSSTQILANSEIASKKKNKFFKFSSTWC